MVLANLVATRSSFVCDFLGTFLCRGTRFRGWNISVSLFRTVDKALLRGFRHSPGQERSSQQTTTRKG